METNRYTMRKSFVLIIAALLVAACGNRKGEQQEMAAGACQDTACAQLPNNPQEQLCAAIGDYLVNEIGEQYAQGLVSQSSRKLFLLDTSKNRDRYKKYKRPFWHNDYMRKKLPYGRCMGLKKTNFF